MIEDMFRSNVSKVISRIKENGLLATWYEESALPSTNPFLKTLNKSVAESFAILNEVSKSSDVVSFYLNCHQCYPPDNLAPTISRIYPNLSILQYKGVERLNYVICKIGMQEEFKNARRI